MYGGKFAFQNRLGWPYSWKEIYRFSLFDLVFEGNFQVQASRGLIFGGAYTWRGLFSEFYGIVILKKSVHWLKITKIY